MANTAWLGPASKLSAMNICRRSFCGCTSGVFSTPGAGAETVSALDVRETGLEKEDRLRDEMVISNSSRRETMGGKEGLPPTY